MIANPVTVGGVNIYPFPSVDDLLNHIEHEKKILIAVNAEKILHATEQIKGIINTNTGYADGIGAVFALKKRGYGGAVKIPGVELWLKIAEKYHSGKSFYLIGAKQEIIEQTVKKLREEFPGINILNYRNGYFDESGRQEIIRDIQEKKPDIVFTALGSPKQELFMEELLHVHPALYMGLGGSFDVYTGAVERAPPWFVRHNLEWAYRLVKQPARITRQIYLIKFILLLFFNKL